jgi:hypothetical protein
VRATEGGAPFLPALNHDDRSLTLIAWHAAVVPPASQLRVRQMATILEFRSRRDERGQAPVTESEARAQGSPAEVILLPRLTLKNLCHIAQAMTAGRDASPQISPS